MVRHLGQSAPVLAVAEHRVGDRPHVAGVRKSPSRTRLRRLDHEIHPVQSQWYFASVEPNIAKRPLGQSLTIDPKAVGRANGALSKVDRSLQVTTNEAAVGGDGDDDG